MMEQFTDKEIFDEFIKRFDLAKEIELGGEVETDWVSLKDIEDVCLGKMGFTFNERGQFIDDLAAVKLETPYQIEEEIYSMDYDSLISLLGEIVERLKSE